MKLTPSQTQKALELLARFADLELPQGMYLWGVQDVQREVIELLKEIEDLEDTSRREL